MIKEYTEIEMINFGIWLMLNYESGYFHDDNEEMDSNAAAIIDAFNEWKIETK